MDKKRILIVEDEKNTRVLFQAIVEFLDYEVDSVETSEKAFEIMKLNKYDILWIDYKLTGSLNGISVFSIMKSYNENLIAILVTGVKDEKLMEEAYSKGFWKVLFKPISIFHIKEVLTVMSYKLSTIELNSNKSMTV